MIPGAWATDSVYGNAFIINDESAGVSGCDAFKAAGPYSDTDTTYDGSLAAAFACINDRGYWLLMEYKQGCVSLKNCDPAYHLRIDLVPGSDVLQGGSFEGLTTEDLIASSVNAYNAYGGNGWSAIDPTKKATIVDLAMNGVRAAGVFNVPICSCAQASEHIHAGGDPGTPRTPTYPCS